jgi:hypothetical protein
MEPASGKESSATVIGQDNRCSRSAAGVVALGLAAGWLAAGSGGMLGHGFQHALMWLVFGAMLVLNWPRNITSGKTWAILGIAVVAAGAMTASSIDVVNILAVVIILSALAYLRGGIDGRVMLFGSTAVFVFAVYRLAFCSLPIIWHLAQSAGAGLGRTVSLLTGQELSIGATFGGVDFLVPMLVLVTVWAVALEKPRRRAILWALAAVILALFAYLLLLAYSEKILACLPMATEFDPKKTGDSNVGIWAWQNMVRSWLPWNLPMAAMVFQAVVAAAMMRRGRWKPGTWVSRPQTDRDVQRAREPRPGDVIVQWGPAILAAMLAVNCTLSQGKTDLTGKTVLALDRGVTWSLPEYGKTFEIGYGLLPHFVKSLGGEWILAKNLDGADLSRADLLLIFQPEGSLKEKDRRRLAKYLDDGGRVLSVAGEENETAVPLVRDWEQSYSPINAPATIGLGNARNPFGFDLNDAYGAALDRAWDERPLIVGRWGWRERETVTEDSLPSWRVNKPLGDLVLAAEKSAGSGSSPKGKIVVLGDANCLSNDALPSSYPFVGRLLAVLADRATSDPGSPGRQALSLVLIVPLLLLLARQSGIAPLAGAAAVLAVGVAACGWVSADSRRVLPQAKGPDAWPIAYIDASHLEAYSSRHWNDEPDTDDLGIVVFARTLMLNKYIPLRLTDLTEERLGAAKLLVSIGPARAFSPHEEAAIEQFVRAGGNFVCLAGAEHSRAVNALLKRFQMTVPTTPVRPGEEAGEPEPWKWPESDDAPKYLDYSNRDGVQFYAPWHVELTDGEMKDYFPEITGAAKERIIAARPIGQGSVTVVADTHFASNRNLNEPIGGTTKNVAFWGWLLQRIGHLETFSPAENPISEMPIEEEGAP